MLTKEKRHSDICVKRHLHERHLREVNSQVRGKGTKLGEGKSTKLDEGGKAITQVRGKGSKLGEPCPKVRLSQDRLPILCLPNVVRANVASSKCHSKTSLAYCLNKLCRPFLISNVLLVCLPLCIHVCLFLCLSVFLSVFFLACLHVRLYVCRLFACLSIRD